MYQCSYLAEKKLSVNESDAGNNTDTIHGFFATSPTLHFSVHSHRVTTANQA